MKQKLRYLLLTLLCMVFSIAWSSETAYKTLTFGSDYNQTSVSGYTSTWSAVCNGFTWDLVNFNNNSSSWNYVRCGRKNYESVATITTKTTIDKAITKVVVTIDAITASKVNSTKLEVASDANFSTNPQTIPVNPTSAGEITYSVPTPSANQYYRLTYDCASGSSNGLVTISKVTYYTNDDTPTKTDIATINSISPTSLTVGDTGTFTADITPVANDYTISWSSTGSALSVSSDGSYTASSAGTATVTVTVTPDDTELYNEVSQDFEITVEAAPITQEDIRWSEDFTNFDASKYTLVNGGSDTKTYDNDDYAGGTSPELLIGKNGGSFTATIDLDNYYGTMTLTFKSNKNNAIIVTATGGTLSNESTSTSSPYTYSYTITVAEGTQTLTLTFENPTSGNGRFDDFLLTGGVKSTVQQKSDPELSYSTTSFTATVGGEFTAPTLVNPHELTGITYSSSDEDLALVDEETGEVLIGDAAGTVTITASFAGNDDYNEGSASYTITISLPDAGLTVTNAPNALYVGNTVDLAWTSESNGAVTFSSNNTSVVSVDADGKLTANVAGTATITVTQAATYTYSADEVTFTVTVTDPSTSTKYVKVTNANQLKAGNKYIIVAEESQGGSYAMGAQSDQYRSAIPVAIVNNEVYVNNATDLTLGGIAGMWTLTAENGMLCLVNVPESGGKIESTNTQQETTVMQKSWRINEETFTVANRENPYWFIIFNYYINTKTEKPEPRFACYRNTVGPNSSLKFAYLYVKEPYTTDENYLKDPLFSINNIIVEMGDETRQLVISTPSDGKANISYTLDDNSVAEIVNNNDGTYTVNPLKEGETNVLASLPQTSEYETAEFTFTIKVVGQFNELASDVYQKVTSNDDLTTGKYLIVYEDGSLIFDGNREILDAAKNKKEVTITDDKIYSHGSYFMINMEAGTIQSQSGYYIGNTDDSNGLNVNKTKQYTNTITIDTDGNAVILASGGAYLRYNSTTTDNRFRYYKSSTYTGQKPIQLYKAIVERNFEFDIDQRATDGTDHYATIADLGLGYFKVNGINGGAVDVYTVVADGDKLTFPVHFSEGDAIPGDGAYLVKGAPGHYKFPATISPDEEVNLGENMLYSTGEGDLSAEDMAAAHDDGTKFYKLSLYKGKVGFFYGAENGAAFNYSKNNQAYLAVPAEVSTGATGYFFDSTTAITEVGTERESDNATYTISGIRVDSKQLPKGIYIVNGKKVVIK